MFHIAGMTDHILTIYEISEVARQFFLSEMFLSAFAEISLLNKIRNL